MSLMLSENDQNLPSTSIMCEPRMRGNTQRDGRSLSDSKLGSYFSPFV